MSVFIASATNVTIVSDIRKGVSINLNSLYIA